MTEKEYKEFRIGDLFEIELSAGDNKASELPKGGIPLISAGGTNNGVVAYVKEGDGKAQIFRGNRISVDMFGKAYYQPKDFYAVSHGRVNILNAKNHITKEALIYIVASLNNLSKKYSYSLMLTSKRVKEETVYLPVTSSGEPDYEYMSDYIKQIQADYIKQIQADYIKQIQAYLEVTGLTDTTLTEEERGALNLQPEWKEFKLKELFEIKRGTRLIVSNRVNGDTPLVTAGYENTGIASYIGNPQQERFVKNTITIDMFGNAFYRAYEYCADDNIISLKQNRDSNKLVLLYITSAINKRLYGKYSYGKQFRLGELDKNSITLPVAPSGELDLEYMETYIRATQKQAIERLVQWNTEQLEMIKTVTGGE